MSIVVTALLFSFVLLLSLLTELAFEMILVDEPFCNDLEYFLLAFDGTNLTDVLVATALALSDRLDLFLLYLLLFLFVFLCLSSSVSISISEASVSLVVVWANNKSD